MRAPRSLVLGVAWAVTACAPVPSSADGVVPPTSPVFTAPTDRSGAPGPSGKTVPSANAPSSDDPVEDTDAAPLSPEEQAVVDAYAAVLGRPADGDDAAATDDALPAYTPASTPQAAPTTSHGSTGRPTGRPTAPMAAPGLVEPRLVSILHGTQPRRAVLALGDGREVVVRAGAMLPGDGVVVLAVGTETVQIAAVRPDGDSAAIASRTLSPMVDARWTPPQPVP